MRPELRSRLAKVAMNLVKNFSKENQELAAFLTKNPALESKVRELAKKQLMETYALASSSGLKKHGFRLLAYIHLLQRQMG